MLERAHTWLRSTEPEGDQLYRLTGVQPQPINTLYQLLAARLAPLQARELGDLGARDELHRQMRQRLFLNRIHLDHIRVPDLEFDTSAGTSDASGTVRSLRSQAESTRPTRFTGM